MVSTLASSLCPGTLSLTSSYHGTQLSSPLSFKLPAQRTSLPLEISAVKKLQGTVVGIKADKTAAVLVKRLTPHPLYKKRMTKSKRYQAHDPENKCKVGDWVTLAKCAPVSKTKMFVVTTIRAARVAGEKMEEEQVQTEGSDPAMSA